MKVYVIGRGLDDDMGNEYEVTPVAYFDKEVAEQVATSAQAVSAEGYFYQVHECEVQDAD